MTAPSAGSPAALAGKSALVLGASRGIGAATAVTFARAGAAVVLAARDGRALEELAGSLRAGGASAHAIPADAADPRSVEALVREAVGRLGRLDVAFNNAGTGHLPAPLADLSVDDLDRAIAVNFRGLFVAMKHEIAAMLAGGGGGRSRRGRGHGRVARVRRCVVRHGRGPGDRWGKARGRSLTPGRGPWLPRLGVDSPRG